MNNGNSPAAPETTADTIQCPACRGEIRSSVKRCPHCGRPTAGSHNFFYYAFWVALSLVVAALIACIFYVGFLLLNRML
jgi:predicted amidophosphoribosyltransferase